MTLSNNVGPVVDDRVTTQKVRGEEARYLRLIGAATGKRQEEVMAMFRDAIIAKWDEVKPKEGQTSEAV